MVYLIKRVLLILSQNSIMSTKKNGNIRIVGRDFSWIEENRKSLAQPMVLDENVQIALRLRKCMKERGWSQKDLAAALGVSPQYVNKILRNQAPTFSVKSAVEYGKKLGCPLIRICSDVDSPNDFFSRTSAISIQEESSAISFWNMNCGKSNGFVFASRGSIRSNQKYVSSNMIAPSYA